MKATKKRGRSPRGEGAQLREALLDAATELLAEAGDADAVSVRAITSRVGVSPTALYLHFDGKEALDDEVKRRCFELLGAELRAADPGEGAAPAERLRALGAAYLEFARRHPGHYAVLFETYIPRSEGDEEKEEGVGMDVFGILVEAVARCGHEPERAFELSVLLWMALHGRASVEVAMPGFPFPDEERYLELLRERIVGSGRAPEKD